jgi:hypothetical protein
MAGLKVLRTLARTRRQAGSNIRLGERGAAANSLAVAIKSGAFERRTGHSA